MGSEFVVRLPVSHAQPAAASEATTPAPAPARGWRILVVDDNHDVAQSLAILLELMGHTVQAVNNAAAALAAVQSYKPSVVFLDMRLADVNGDDLARALRSVAPNSRMHFIALTGYGDEELRRRVTAAGFAAHLLKPATVEALESALVSLPTLE
jgi:CheY-like chemotaxis protein